MDEETENDTAAIAAILDDEYARAILAATSMEPMSATTLSETCDASPQTIYRRVDDLKRHELLTERVQVDPDGNHYAVYTARLDAVTVRLDDGKFTVEITRTEPDVADRFTRYVENLR
ncbi:hypothetical protein ZOD2009_09780 [Haladaptatus paucihalophilus DX253]|uniref:Helix-turn-helix domain-containing protein n=1 Tax=Haladaptatus paucihalophilus DX253 TaxID=797209 RepID=E7QT56_HALPU|nr:winged helix-turn-helix domain-containing protein [Haladaptatus paucihalophilus]EFW92337.1 hypothetical protein ZOD2009_09780 [Haladaptatus paucihalophilus DX253]SHL60688.1 Helix-turn-helix domain-containing protein [Haladaptatus paucihalophilus DX253]